jgi:copper resistance protein B
LKAALLAGLATFALAAPAAAQHSGHAGHNMPGMRMPAKPAAKPAPKRKPAAKPVARKAQPRAAAKPPARKAVRPAATTRRTPAVDPHAGHAMPATGGAAADPHTGHNMQDAPAAAKGGQAATPADPHAGHTMPGAPQAGQPAPADPHAGHGVQVTRQGDNVAQDPHAGHDMGAMADHSAPIGTNLPAGNAPAPTAFPGSAAGRFYGEEEMAREVRDLKREHGGGIYRQVIFNLAEAQIRDGRDGYRWDGEAWIGGDINRLAIKKEGAGEFGRPMDDAEVQLLYNRALDPYVNFQAGVRYDFKPNPSRAYTSVGFEALAPYWFDVEGTVFLSDKGEVLARAEAYYDQRITNWWVLQPRAELNFAAQDVPENGIGSGLSDIELGLRLRYELRREFAPYIGVSWDRKLGDTARFARAEGESTGGFSLVTGVRVWF